ncbi:phage head spike fiber domain-containing protein [Pseudomonas knackmussii]|uniref:phage head spike fiber domain-containing protein n=1 Tax=Pseudomonas knackmussii TaxID=65741 RepID=UPI003F49F7BF
MATGDQQNMFDRLVGLLPAGWFGDSNPIRDALLWGYAQALAWAYTLYLYAKAQARIKTATDGWLDLIALDFFGNNLLRNSNQADSSYRNRILINIFRERATRHAVEQVLLDLTGRMPKIIEPARPADVGAYGAAVAVSQPGTTTMIDNGKLVFVPQNTPRYQNGVLLIEEQRTNLLLYSSTFSNAAWTKANASITSGATTAPDGTSSASKLVEDTTSNTHQINQISSSTGQRTFTVFAKAGERTQIQLGMSDLTTAAIYANFDLSTGTLLGTTSGGSWTAISQSISSVGSGWYRLSFTATAGSGTQVRAVANIYSGGTATYLGDGVSGLYLWGAQLEAGAAQTSYIPTTSAQVTRAADTLLNNMPAGSAALGGYGSAGAYGSLIHPYQAFITAYRPSGQGLPYVAGYGVSTGGYSTPSRADYAQLSPGDVTDADIYAAIDSVKPYGSVAWVRIAS